LEHVADIAIDDGVVGVSTSMSATSDGVFAGGDAVPQNEPRRLPSATASGRHGIDAYSRS